MVRTGRLLLQPVGWQDLPDLQALKGDPAVYAQMLGGVRTPAGVAAELASDLAHWGAHGVGMWLVRQGDGPAVGLVGIHQRADGRNPALRFAFHPRVRGQGIGREAAGAALRFAHDNAGLPRVYAVARDSNIASRTVLGAIGMRPCEHFIRDNEPVTAYESLAYLPPLPPGEGRGEGVFQR